MKMKTKNNIIYYLIFLIGIFILINIISDRFFFRLDFTSDERYTLSEATKDILSNLEEPVTVTAYFTEGLQPEFDKIRRDLKDLLIEYETISDKNVVFEFINPNESTETEQKAQQAGIRPVIINVREKDQNVQKRAYLGAIVQLGEKTEAIPFMQQGAAMEYALSSSIKKLTVIEKPSIGFIQGHGEPSLQSYHQAMTSLSVLYDVEPVDLGTHTDLDKYTSLAIVAPTDSFPSQHLEMLNQYLEKGKNLFVAMDRVEGDFNTSRGTELTTGLEKWLKEKGISVENDFVVDANCGSVQVRQQQGMMTFSTNVQFPYFPIIKTFSKHPITSGLEALVLQFASSINYIGDSTLLYTPLAMTSEKSGTQNCPTFFNVNKKWEKSDLPLSNITVAALLEGNIVGNNHSRMIVVSDGDFPVNGEGRQAKQVSPDNINLLVNSIDWLSDDTGLIELRTKGITLRPIDEMEDSQKAFLKWFNFLLPILLIIIIGIFRYQKNRILRTKRMKEDYV